MPTYEYQCNTCGHQFEQEQAITSEPLTECPKCQGRISRLLSGGTGFILKGSGHGESSRGASDCSFEQTGTTCCGRSQRCETPSCK
jgi:putative FmdB family regulatory protein